MADVPALITTAQRLIKENGRSVTLIGFNTTVAVADKPWDGPTDPRVSPAATLVLSAVFVQPASATKLGLGLETSDLIQRAEQIMIIAPGAEANLGLYQEVDDGGERWKISGVEILRPGSLLILAFIGVKR